MRQGIYWIASYPRSGNTWVRAFLTALIEKTDSVEHLTGELLAPWWATEIEKPNAETSEIETIRRNEQAQVRLAGSAPGTTFRKTHAGRFSAEGAHTISPTATIGAVYLLRDPRDVAMSFAAFLEQDVIHTIFSMNNPGFGYAEPVGSWSNNVESWVDRPDTLVVRYEDLLVDPLACFSRIVEHVGLTADSSDVSRAVNAVSFERLKKRDQAVPLHKDQVTVRSAKVGGWKGRLSPGYIEMIERAHAPTMRRFGYL
jgi:hypothetical protein